jgi:histone-lysine N-methyltransferase SETD3
MVSSRIFGI